MQPELKTFASAYEDYQQLYEDFDYFSASPTERKKYSDWLQSMMQYNGEMQGARDEGRAKGRMEGRAEGCMEWRAEGRILIATNLLAMGLTVDNITQATDLPLETILSLKVDLENA
ncbi:MAG: hypothetical protein FWG65_09015 [Turicibacter sp.]|nr:hypothetical protein [Turicibacter sp.]